MASPLSRIASSLPKVIRLAWQRGLRDTAMIVRKNIAHEFRWYLDRRFDRIHGTDTSDNIPLDVLRIDGENRNQGIYYEPTSTDLFRHMMAQLKPALRFEDFVFIDYGSGKGRTLMMASDYPFIAIIGVEFAHELHLAAEHNLSIYHGRRQCCKDLAAVHADATAYQPPAQNLLVYFYNPFLKEVMGKVLGKLAQASLDHGTRIVLLYFNPLSADVVESSGLFKRRQEIRLPHDYTREVQRRCTVYFSWPEAPGSAIV